MTVDRSSRGDPSFFTTLWGRRGIVKSGSLWLPLTIFISLTPGTPHPGAVSTSLGIFLAIACWAMTSVLANDLADCRQDRAAGKSRWICGLDSGAAVGSVCGFIVTGAGSLLIFGAPWVVFGMYFVSLGLGLAYSLKPFRFKSAGGWGFAAYGLACVGAYVILPGIWLGAGRLVVLILGAAVFFDKSVNLLFHQMLDHDTDGLMQVSTLAVKWGRSKTRRRLRPAAFLAVLVMISAVLVAVKSLPGSRVIILGTAAAGWAACMIGVGKGLKDLAGQSELTKRLPLFYLSATLVVFRLLPLLLLVRLSLYEPAYWSLTVGAGALIGLDLFYSYRYRLP